MRLILHTAAYWLILNCPRHHPRDARSYHAEFTTIRLRLLKLGARVIEMAAHVRLAFAAYDKALAEGVGAVTVDDKMIDVPVVERAGVLLEREAAIAAREARRP